MVIQMFWRFLASLHIKVKNRFSQRVSKRLPVCWSHWIGVVKIFVEPQRILYSEWKNVLFVLTIHSCSLHFFTIILKSAGLFPKILGVFSEFVFELANWISEYLHPLSFGVLLDPKINEFRNIEWPWRSIKHNTFPDSFSFCIKFLTASISGKRFDLVVLNILLKSLPTIPVR